MKGQSFVKRAICFAIIFLLMGCAAKEKSIKRIESDPETLYKQGLILFNKGNYIDASKKFEEIRSLFPDSPPYTVWAELKIGDCHFLKEEYVEAIAAYEGFKKLHPTHEEMPYIQYQIGAAYFNQMRPSDRDQNPTLKALANFEYLVANYPSSLFTEKAKEKIEICRKRLADQEFYIGDFYYKQGRFRAAASRFEGLLDKFPKIPDEDKTLFFLGKSYLELKQGEKAREAFSKIIAGYPQSPYFKEAEAFLNQGGKEKEVSLHKVVSSPSPKAESALKVKPEKEEQIASVSSAPTIDKEKKTSEKKIRIEPEGIQPMDTTQPIDITSDKVETHFKENLIVFKGNVMARQKDIVIYADSLEAIMIEGGKGIEKVIAGGNVKIQQGLRVANCQKAVFYNVEQKVVLTGDPKVSEGENIVSGDEIIFDIEQDRVEVKGGAGGRGKATIHPGEELERTK